MLLVSCAVEHCFSFRLEHCFSFRLEDCLSCCRLAVLILRKKAETAEAHAPTQTPETHARTETPEAHAPTPFLDSISQLCA